MRRANTGRSKAAGRRLGIARRLRPLGLTWAWLALLPLLGPGPTPVDLGASASLRLPDPGAPPGPGDRTPPSGVLDRAPAASHSSSDALAARSTDRRPLPGPIGEERPGHRNRVDRPPRLAA